MKEIYLHNKVLPIEFERAVTCFRRYRQMRL